MSEMRSAEACFDWGSCPILCVRAAENTAGSRNSKDRILAAIDDLNRDPVVDTWDPLNSLFWPANERRPTLFKFQSCRSATHVSRKTRAFEGLPRSCGALGGLLDAVDGLKLTQTRSRKIEVALAV